MSRHIKSIKQGRKHRVKNLNGVWCMSYELSQIQSANRLLHFLFRNDNCYLIIEFANEEVKKEFTKNNDVLFEKNENVCVLLTANDLQDVVLDFINTIWESNEEEICSVLLVDMACDIYAVKELIEKNKDIFGYVKNGISSFYIDVDDPFEVVCTFDFDKHSSIISKNLIGQYFIHLPFELN